MPSYNDAAGSLLMTKSKASASLESAAEPLIIFHPFSLGVISANSFRDMGMVLRYFPGTVFPDRTTETAASGSFLPFLIISMEMYSTLSAPASSAAPAMERIIGEMYGGTPNAAGSSMYPSIRAITISFPMFVVMGCSYISLIRDIGEMGDYMVFFKFCIRTMSRIFPTLLNI